MNNWISVKDRLPDIEKPEKEYCCTHSSKVLVQTSTNDMFVATMEYSKRRDTEYIRWYSYGTGGKKMRVMSKVVAWMPLPELYKY